MPTNYTFNYGKVIEWASEFVENIDRTHSMDEFQHEEIVQRAAIKVWKHEKDFSSSKCTPRGFVAMITKKEAYTEYNRTMTAQKRFRSYDSSEFGVLDWARGMDKDTDWLVCGNEAAAIWDKSVDELSERDRRVIRMVDDEYTNDEIASVEGLSKNAAAKLRFDAKNRFEARLSANGYYDYLPVYGEEARAC